MTIVATEDSRNAEWKNGNKGSALLKKMGWVEGQGLGRQKQGSAVALRAVKRSDELLGIGAASRHAAAADMDGWNDTSNSFATVLSKLQQHHGESNSDSDGKTKKKKKKNELTLARNKVTAGHSKKMREAKCLKSKSDEDMAAIFGTKDFNKSEKKRSRDDCEEAKKKKKKKSKSSSR